MAERTGSKTQNINAVDLICEGPIRGLVGDLQGVYIDDVAVDDGKFSKYIPVSTVSSGLITFVSGVGTTSEDLPANLVFNPELGRSLVLTRYESHAVSLSSNFVGNGRERYSASAITGAPFTTAEWGTLGNYTNKSVYLYREGQTIKGTFGVISGSQPNGLFTATAPTGIDVTKTDWNIGLAKAFRITEFTSNSTLTVVGTVPDGTYNFYITNQNQVNDTGAQTFNEGLFAPKINDINVQFRSGTLYQTPLNEVGGVGAAIGIEGTPPSTQDLRILKAGTYNGDTFSPIDINGLPNIQGTDKKAYPGNPDIDEYATTQPTYLNAANFGLNTEAKLAEADEISFTIRYPSLQVINLQKGDKEDAYAFYKMEIRFKEDSYTGDGSGSWGNFVQLFPNEGTYIKHKGNTSSPVDFEHTININQYRPFSDFQIRIMRATRQIGIPVRSDGTSRGTANDIDGNKKKWQMNGTAAISAMGAVIKDRLAYPYSSLVSLSFDSADYDSLPPRSYLLEGLKVQIPNTYTPREYTKDGVAKYEGFWDGTFREAKYYTDNPAWVFYDIVINNRYGAGKWMTEEQIDKYALYRVARYCDELVDDGSGGLEPRFRSNIFLTKATDVYKVLKDMATVFLGIMYWQNSKLVAVQDAPQDPVYNFTKGNVIDGSFAYESTGARTRVNQVVVTWNDPEANFAPVPLIVEDRNAILKAGRIISEAAVAFGATSEAQAYRYGRWKLWTAQNQTEIVQFKTSLAAQYIKPGDVINVQDADRYGLQYSGRVSKGTDPEGTLTLSRTITPGQVNGSEFTVTERSQPAIFGGQAVLPSTFTQDAVLFEHGATGQGCWVGVRQISGEYNLVIRAGDGSPTPVATDVIIAEVPISKIPQFDGGTHTVVWEFVNSPGTIRLWIDNILYVNETNTSLGGTWSGGDAGGWGESNGSTAGNYSTNAWPVPPTTNLRYYNQQTVPGTYVDALTTIKLDRTIELNFGSTYELSTLVAQPAAFLADTDSVTINSVVYEPGQRIPEAFVNGTLTALDSESAASNAFTAASGGELVPTVWKPYTYIENNAVTTSSGNTDTISVTAFNVVPSPQTVWALKETSDSLEVNGSFKEYKVLSITEDGNNEYTVSGVEHYNEKYDAVDKNYTLGYLPDTIYADKEPANIPVPRNVRVVLPKGTLSPRNFLLEWDNPLPPASESTISYLSGYEVRHNVPGRPQTLTTKGGSLAFSDVPNGDYLFKIRAVSAKGNVSDWISLPYAIRDKYKQNVDRVQGGMPKGILSSSPAGLTTSTDFAFLDAAFVASSVGDKETLVTTTNNTLSFADVEFQEDYYIVLDQSASVIKLVKWEAEAIRDVEYWRDAGTGNASLSSGWTSVGNVSISANTTTVTGTNFVSNSTIQVNDLLKLEGLDFSNSAKGAFVTAIISDTELRIDRTFSSALTSVAAHVYDYRPDYDLDAAIAHVTESTSAVYSVEKFITIDESISTGRSVQINVSPSSLTYDSSGSQTNTPSAITATVSAIGFTSPEFRITTTGGLDGTDVSTFTTSNTADPTVYSFTADSNGAVAYDSNSLQTITASVREASNTAAQRGISFNLSKLKDGTSGSAGEAGVTTAVVYAYQRSATTLTSNPGDTVVSLSTGQIITANLGNSWSSVIPSGNNPLYVVAATAAGRIDGSSSTDTVLAAEWSSPVVLSQDGESGSAGAPGLRTVQGNLYYESTSGEPSPPAGTTYTFSTGLVSGTGIGTGVDVWTNEPRTQDPTSSNVHYILRYSGTEATAESLTLNVTYSASAIQFTEFTGVVSFTDLSAAGTTEIHGANINTGQITLDSAGLGHIKAGKTSYSNSATAGFYLGFDADESNSTAALFHIGDSNQSMRWTGSSLEIKGDISASSVRINQDGTLILSSSAAIVGDLEATSVKAGGVNVAALGQDVLNLIDGRVSSTVGSSFPGYYVRNTAATKYSGTSASTFFALDKDGNGSSVANVTAGPGVETLVLNISHSWDGFLSYSLANRSGTAQFLYRTDDAGAWQNAGSAINWVIDEYFIDLFGESQFIYALNLYSSQSVDVLTEATDYDWAIEFQSTGSTPLAISPTAFEASVLEPASGTTTVGSGSADNASTLGGLSSTQFLRSDVDDSAAGEITFANNHGVLFASSSAGGPASRLYRAGGNATRFSYYENSFIFDAEDDTPFEIRTSTDETAFKVSFTSTSADEAALDFNGNAIRFPNIATTAAETEVVTWNDTAGLLGRRVLGTNAFNSTSYLPTAGGTVTGNLIVSGDLDVNGTTTTIDSSVVSVSAKTITVARNATTSSQADGAGLFVEGADASILYSNSGTKWILNRNTVVQGVLTVGTGGSGIINLDDNTDDDDHAIRFRNTLSSDNVTTVFEITTANDDLNLKAFGSSREIALHTNNGERMRIDASGNVGIGGATNPSTTLQVGDGTTDTRARVYYSDNSYTEVRGFGIEFNRATAYLRSVTAGTQQLVIGGASLSADNASNDWSSVDFRTNNVFFRKGQVTVDRQNFTIKTESSNTAGLLIFDNVDGAYNWWNYQATDNKLTWTVTGSGGAEMQLQANGTTHSSAELVIGGGATVGGKVNVRDVTAAGVVINGTGTIGSSTYANGWLRIGTSSGITMDNNEMFFSGVNDAYFGTLDGSHLNIRTNQVTRLFISGSGSNTGFIGIGTTNPREELEVHGTTWLYGEGTGSAEAAVLKLGTLSNNPDSPLYNIYTDDDSNDRLEINTARYGQSFLVSRGSAAGGRVRSWETIATTNGDERGTDFIIYSQPNSQTSASGGTTTTNGNVRISAVSNRDSYINTTSNFMLGTDTSLDNTAKLHIAGKAGGYARIVMSDVDGTNQKTYFTQSGGSTSITTQNNTSNGIFNINGFNGTTTTEFVRVDSTGSMGIGTTLPSEKLEVNGRLKVQAGDAATSAYSIISNGGDLVLKAGADDVVLRTGGSGSEGIYFQDGAQDTKMFINAENGNVGIGTTSPGGLGDYSLSSADALFHVVGPTTTGQRNIVARFQAGNDADNTAAGIIINHSNDRGIAITAGRGTSDEALVNFSMISSGGTVQDAMTFRRSAAGVASSVGINEDTNLSTGLTVRGGNYASNQNSGLVLQSGDAGSSHWRAGLKIKSTSGGVPRVALDVMKGTSGSVLEAVVFERDTGFVGIGTTDPDKALVVSGSGAEAEIVINDSTGSPSLRFRNGGITNGSVSTNDSGNLLLSNSGKTIVLTNSQLSPTSALDGTLDLGGSTARFNDLHLSGTAITTRVKDPDSISNFIDLTITNSARYIQTYTDRLVGRLTATNHTGTILSGMVPNIAIEDNGFKNYGLLNRLAGSNQKFNVTATNGGTGTSISDSAFIGDSIPTQFTVSSSTSQVIITIEDISPTVLFTAFVGITFGNSSFRARDVKIETFRNGAWQTECDLTDQQQNVVARQVSGNDANGVEKVRYTLANPANTSGMYFRINSLWLMNYNSGFDESGYFVEKWRNSTLYKGLTLNSGGALNFDTSTSASNLITLDGTKTLLRRHSSNGAVSFGADDGLVIGAGEARSQIVAGRNMASEILYLGAEGGVNIITHPNNWTADAGQGIVAGYAGRNEMTFNNAGALTVNSNRVFDASFVGAGTRPTTQLTAANSHIVWDNTNAVLHHKDLSNALTSPIGGIAEADIIDPVGNSFKMIGSLSHIDGHITGGTILELDFSTSDHIDVVGSTSSVGALNIRADSITASLIQAEAITASAIQAGAITASAISASVITADKIEAGAITTDKLSASAVTADKIEAGAITTDKLSASAVTADKIQANAITAAKIAASTITGTEISSTTSIIAGSGNNIGALDGTGTIRIYAGNATASSAPFRVTQAGALTATNATITGDITDL